LKQRYKANPRHVLVTGGAGYVGSHACRMLARMGYLPITLDNLTTGHEWAVRWGPLEIGDVADPIFVRDVIARYQPAAVMHFAAFSLVGESDTNPSLYYGNNVASTLSLLDTVRAAGIDRVIFSSTCAIYGQPLGCPIDETAVQQPINTYGRSKQMVETILQDYATAYDLKVTALRYFNAAGAAADDGIGEAHACETHLIPLVIETALGKRGPVNIFGTDYPTPDGSCQRDYVHVNDLALAHVQALDSGAAQPAFRAFNLGTGRPFSVYEIIAAVENLAGRMIPQQSSPRRPGDPAILFADPARAHKGLGWQPTQSDLATMVGSAWSWHASSYETRHNLRHFA
jgi:UDP-glucose-4-epimerase GalE